jgi:hypothetical protein
MVIATCLVAELVAYIVSQLNIRCTSALSENVCPRVLFSSVPINYKKELSVAFGDYVEAYEGTATICQEPIVQHV